MQGFPGGSEMVKSLITIQETWDQPLGWEDQGSILAWRIPWIEEPGGLQSMGLQRVEHDWITKTFKIISILIMYSCILYVPIMYLHSVQLLSRVRLFATPWIAAHQSSLSITNSRSLLKLMPIELVMPSSHLILCRPLLLLPPIPPSIRIFSNESTVCMRWPKYWSFSFSISPSNEHPGLISFRMDWLDLLAVQGDSQESSPTPQFKSINFSATLRLFKLYKYIKNVKEYKRLVVLFSEKYGKII